MPRTRVLAAGLAAVALALPVGPAGAAPTWLPDVPLTPEGWGVRATALVDGSGNVSAVWSDGAPADVAGSRRLVGGSWEAKERVVDNVSSYPSVAVEDRAGWVTAAWYGSLPDPNTMVETYFLFSARRSPTGAWSAPEVLYDGPGAFGVPTLGVDAAGNVSIVYRPDVAGGNVEYRRRTQTGAWEPAVALSLGAGVDPAISVAPSGRVAVFFYRQLPTENMVLRERLTNGQWTEPQLFPAVNAVGPAVALADDGTLDLAWSSKESVSNQYQILGAYRPAGGSVGAATPITAPSANMGGLQLVSDGVGGAVGAYKDGPFYSVHRNAGSPTWSAREITPHTAGQVDLAAGPGGLVAMAYQAQGEVNGIEVMTRLPGSPWTSPTLISSGTTFLGSGASVVIDDEGNITVVYEQFEGPNVNQVRIHTRTLDTAGPASTLVAPTLTTKRNIGLSWSALDRWSAVANHDVRMRSATWKKKSALPSYAAWKTATTATSGSVKGKPGRTYCFSSRATDSIANVGPWTADQCVVLPVDDSALKASSAWSKGKGKAYFAKTFQQTSAKGATLTLGKVKARTIGLLADRLPKGGKVVIRIGKTKIGSVSLKGKANKGEAILVKTLAAAKAGTLTITVVSSGKPVRIDGVFLGK